MNQIIDQLFRVAIYLRLSKDDGDFSLSGNGKTESNSIHNQRELIMNFLANHPEMELVGEYKDDGYTGTNFDRPDFQRMMADIRKGLINCVIVKDLSRFGRDYIDCGKYIEKLFPQLRVRFIAINDHYDTAEDHHSDSILIPFKNLINDSYSRDISVKVRSNLAVKRQQGEFIGNYAVFGYMKDPANKNHLIIDEYAAAVVRNIFRWKIEGFSSVSIADRLNKAGILSPMEYKKAQGSRFETTFKKTSVAEWRDVAVRRILKNEVYTGVMVQGKRTTPNYKTKTTVVKDRSEWVRIENTHEAIISRADFELVQRLLKEDTRAGSMDMAVHPLCGRIFCADCGAPVIRKTVATKKKTYVYFVCSAYKNKTGECTQHQISEERLFEAVLVALKVQIEAILDMEKALKTFKSITWEKSELAKIEKSIAIQEQIIEKNNALQLGVYEDFQSGILTRDEYVGLRDEFVARIDGARDTIQALLLDKSEIEGSLDNQKGWLEQFHQYTNLTVLDRRMVVSLIDKVFLFEGNAVEVVLRHKNQLDRIHRFLQEQEQLGVKAKLVLLPTAEVV